MVHLFKAPALHVLNFLENRPFFPPATTHSWVDVEELTFTVVFASEQQSHSPADTFDSLSLQNGLWRVICYLAHCS